MILVEIIYKTTENIHDVGKCLEIIQLIEIYINHIHFTKEKVFIVRIEQVEFSCKAFIKRQKCKFLASTFSWN